MRRSWRPRAGGWALAAILVAVGSGVLATGRPAGAPPAGATGAGGGGGRAAAVTVHLTASHSRFSPAAVTVAPGAVVRFVVRNLDPIDHEFIVGPPAVHARHAAGGDAVHHGDVPGEISVAAGATATTTWTAPRAPGPVVFACHLPGHLAHGMEGVVTVAG